MTTQTHGNALVGRHCKHFGLVQTGTEIVSQVHLCRLSERKKKKDEKEEKRPTNENRKINKSTNSVYEFPKRDFIELNPYNGIVFIS